ncbi:MAG: DUF5681 domain-containing protein [Alsobacter sp.]
MVERRRIPSLPPKQAVAAADESEAPSQAPAPQPQSRPAATQPGPSAASARAAEGQVTPGQARPAAEPIGYGRPPKHSQFKPGQSGNPRGRAKGSQNMRTLLEAELKKTVRVREEGRTRKRSKGEIVAAQLVNRAVQGEPRAVDSLFRFMDEPVRGARRGVIEPAVPHGGFGIASASASPPSALIETFLAMAREADPQVVREQLGLDPSAADENGDEP